MNRSELLSLRLVNQQIAATRFKTPQQIVGYMAAMQAQEYAVSKWAIGLRLQKSSNAIVEKAFNDGKILRTHVLRPTWHFVTPQDIHWMLQLTAPRVHAFNAFMYRKMELDAKALNKSSDVICRALEGGKFLTRDELKIALEKVKIKGDTIRMSCIMMYAELEALICSGPRIGKQFTYALMDERVPEAKEIHKEESLAELAKRYFSSRGPATLQDFAWWSGLTIKECKEAVSMLDKKFKSVFIEGKEYIFIPAKVKALEELNANFLMPDYDEYGIAYKDRTAIFSPVKPTTAFKADNPIFDRMIIMDGIIAGTWKRIEKNNSVTVQTVPFTRLSTARQQILDKAVKRFVDFFEPA